MTIFVRRLLYVFAIILFIAVGVWLVAYSRGVRLVLSSRLALTHVGALYVKSYPSGAAIAVDGIPTGATTPSRVLNIPPGARTITVAKDGFASWEKKLTITERETTFVRDIVLFRSDTEPVINGPGGTDVVIADDHSVYAYRDANNAIRVSNTATGSTYTLQSTGDVTSLLDLSPDKQSLLTLSGAGLEIININTEKRINITKTKTITSAYFDRLFGTTVWYLANHSVTHYDSTTGVIRSTYPSVDALLVTDTLIVLGSHTKNGTIVRFFDANDMTKLAERTIPSATPTGFVQGSYKGIIVLTDTTTAWVVSNDTNDPVIILDATYAEWRGPYLLYGTRSDIRILNTDTGSSSLIDRSSNAITKVWWHPSGSYLLRYWNDTLEFIELDDRDHRNIIPIATIPSVQSVVFDPRGEMLNVVTSLTNAHYQIQ